ncbi:hypothetical protein KUW04_16450 [Halomonas denitrificans]|nr:hypothetical protein [Halomonas denitrificans]
MTKAGGHWPLVFSVLGIPVPSVSTKHGPCPSCGGKDRFRFDDLEGRGTWHCNQCGGKHGSGGGGDGLSLVAKVLTGGDLMAAAELVASVIGISPKDPLKPDCSQPSPDAGFDQLTHRQAAAEAARILSELCEPAESSHWYLTKKQIGSHGVYRLVDAYVPQRIPAGALVVPVHVEGQLASLEFIASDRKRGLKGGRKRGGHFIVGDLAGAEQVWLAEGLATAVTLHEATQLPAVCCFSAGQIDAVALQLRASGFVGEFLIAEDDDNAGAKVAQALNETGEVRCFRPPFSETECQVLNETGKRALTDWNDFAAVRGCGELREYLMREIVESNPTFSGKQKGTLTPFERAQFPDIREYGDGKPPRVLNTRENLMALLEHHGFKATVNAMTLEVELFRFGELVPQSEEQTRSDLLSLASVSGLPMTAIDYHMKAAAEACRVHPVRTWLERGKWDKVPRLSKVIECANAREPEVAQLVLRKWMIGAVASLYESHFSSKLVPVLQGGQSYKKTAFISRLANVVPDAFLEGAELNPDNKDSVLPVIKAWIVELGELERTSKNSQGSLKAFITKAVDTVRPPYGRTDIKKPRQTHLVASVNGTGFLRDDTGSSRYAVIEMAGPAELDTLNCLLGWRYSGNGSVSLNEPELLRQLWLEVKALYDKGESWQLSAADVARIAPINDRFKAISSIELVLRDLVAGDTDKRTELKRLKASEVCQLAGIPVAQAQQVGQVLSVLADDGVIRKTKGKGTQLYHVPVPVHWRP